MTVDEDTMIKISNKTTRFSFTLPMFFVILTIVIYGYILSNDLVAILIVFSILISILLYLHHWLYKIAPWDLPDAYIVTDDELWFTQNYVDGGSFEKYKLSAIEKIVFNNRRDKEIQLWFKEGNQRLKILSAPYFEKCNTEWQQLFDEIRKRLPPEAEVIVK